MYTTNVNVGQCYKDHFTWFAVTWYCTFRWPGRGGANNTNSLWALQVTLHITIFPDTLTLVHTVLITPASVSVLSASWLHLSYCWFCAGRLDWAAVRIHPNGSKTFLPVSSIYLGTLCSEGSFPLTSSPATSRREGSLTTSAVKGNGLQKI